MNQPLRLVFLGSDPIALPLLDWLAGEGSAVATVVAVYTQPDKPVGRGQQLTANPVKRWAQARSLPLRQPEKLDEPERTWLAGLGADLALVMAYGHILRDDFIATPRLGSLNLHTSLLPKYRGASPIQTAIACGETESGVTLMRIVRKLDAGPLAAMERFAIGRHDTTVELEAALAAACVPLLARTLPKLAAGTLAFADQDESAASYCRKLRKEDAALDWNSPAELLAARINGLYPWPGCTTELGGQTIKLGLADALPGPGGRPAGEVIGADGEGLLVAGDGGSVRLLRLQRPGGKMLPAPDFLRGFQVPAGTKLPSLPMAPLVSPAPFPR